MRCSTPAACRTPRWRRHAPGSGPTSTAGSAARGHRPQNSRPARRAGSTSGRWQGRDYAIAVTVPTEVGRLVTLIALERLVAVARFPAQGEERRARARRALAHRAVRGRRGRRLLQQRDDDAGRHRAQGRRGEHQRARHRRDGHREGGRRAGRPPLVASRRPPVHPVQLHRRSEGPGRQPAVRSPQGVVHRRHRGPPGRHSRRVGRHPLSGRGRRPRPRRAAEAPALPRVERDSAARRAAPAARRRAHHRLHQPEPPADGRRRPVPRGSLLPPQRRPAARPAAARAPGGGAAARRALPPPRRTRLRQGGAAPRRGNDGVPGALSLARQRPAAGQRDAANGGDDRARRRADARAPRPGHHGGQEDGRRRSRKPGAG